MCKCDYGACKEGCDCKCHLPPSEKDRLRSEVATLKLQNGELTEKCAALAQTIHDLRSHVASFPLCMEKPCYDAWVAAKQSRRTKKREGETSDRQHLLERCYLELYGSMNDEREHKRDDCLKAARAIANRIAEIDNRMV